MVLLQPRLNVKLSQKQILTPGLVQMVSVLALNKLELKDMINTEMVENPVLEEFDPTVPMLDDVAGKEEARERDDARERQQQELQTPAPAEEEKKDPFEEIDFGSFFRDYLDPGYRSASEMEESDRPSFENFLSKPTTLTDHLLWQLGSVSISPCVRAAAELIIGNLNEEGYLTASEDELLGGVLENANGNIVCGLQSDLSNDNANGGSSATEHGNLQLVVSHTPLADVAAAEHKNGLVPVLQFSREDLRAATRVVQHFDPVGVAARDLRECLLAQLEYLVKTRDLEGSDDPENDQVVEDALKIVEGQIHFLQNKQYKEIAKAIGRPLDAVLQAHEFIRTLDPKPGLRYNRVEPKLLE